MDMIVLKNLLQVPSSPVQRSSSQQFHESNVLARDAAVVAAVVTLSMSSYCSPTHAAAVLDVSSMQPAQVALVRQLDDSELFKSSRIGLQASTSLSIPASTKPLQAIPVLAPVAKARFLARILQHLGGGGIAGAIGAALVYPLDTIKTRMQAQSTKDGEQPHFKNELDCLKKLVSDEGMGSLYSGLIPQLVGIAPEKAMKLTVNELLLEVLEHMMPGAGVWALELIAGGGGGFSQVIFTNPVEIVKVRLQTSKGKGLLDVIKELGFQGLYFGAGVTMARDIPSSGVFFACYALLKQLYPDQSFADGFLAAIPATLVSNPMDVVKTRLQMELPPGEEPHRSGLDCLKALYAREGVRALFKGSLARVLRTSPQFGITLLLYSLLCS